MTKYEIEASKKGYSIDVYGNVFNKDGNKLKPSLRNGYLCFSIRLNGKMKKVSVHRYQAYNKYGNRIYELGTVTRHLDGNPLNNQRNNIAIGTQSDNMMDCSKEVRQAKAERATSFVRKYDKQEVREYYQQNKSYKKTMDRFGISSKGTLHHILNN